MAKSMLRQITQVSGSYTYNDDLVPSTGWSNSYDLETDLNYIRSQIKLAIDRTNWYDTPRDIVETISGSLASDDQVPTAQAVYEWVNTVSGAITSSDTFAGLEDTPAGYNDTEVLFYTADGVSSSGTFTFDDATGNFNVGASNAPRFTIDAAAGTATMYGDDDTYIVVSGTGYGFAEGGNLEFSITSDGIALADGARVDNILNTADADTIDSSSTDAQLATAKLIWNTISGALDTQDTFLELDDTIGSYTENRVLFETATTVSDSANFTYDPGSGLDVAEHVAFGANASIDSGGGVPIIIYAADEMTGANGVWGMYLDVDQAAEGANANSVGIYASVGSDSSTDLGNVEAINALATSSAASASVEDMAGVIAATSLTGNNSTVNSMTAGTFRNFVNASSSTIGTMTAGYFDVIWSQSSAATVTDAYGVRVRATGAVSSGTNIYGLYIDDMSGENFDVDYNIYSAGANSMNKFEGTIELAAGADVNEILSVEDGDTIDASSTDDQLATAKLIYNHVDSVSGTLQSTIDALDHDEDLNGLNGGSGGEYWHVSQNVYNAMSSDGSTLFVVQDIDLDGDINVSGTLSFDGGTAVDNIVTEMSEPGADTNLVTEQGIVEYVDSVSGTLQTDIIWEIVDTPTTQIRPKIEHLQKAIYTEGNVTIGGNLTVTGTLFYADTETVQVEDNLMVINYGEVGAGVTAGEAGIQVDRGSETDYMFLFDEGTDTFRIGVSGTQSSFNVAELQPVATREDVPLDTRVAWWDADDYTFRTQGDTYITVVSGGAGSVKIFADSAQRGEFGANLVRLGDTGDTSIDIDQSANTIVFDANKSERMRITDGGMKLPLGSVDVNDIQNVTDGDSISAASTDDQLVTAKLIYDTISGTIIDGSLTGGTPTYMYYVGADGMPATTGNMLYTATYARIGPTSTTYFNANNGNTLSLVSNSEAIVNGQGGGSRQLTLMRAGGGGMIIQDKAPGIVLYSPSDNAELTVNSSGIKLLNGTATVNEILSVADANSISSASTDDQLATAKLIYTTYSGLENIVGGTPDNMFYVDNNGNPAETSYMTFDADGTVNVLALTDNTQRIGQSGDTYLNLNQSSGQAILYADGVAGLSLQQAKAELQAYLGNTSDTYVAALSYEGEVIGVANSTIVLNLSDTAQRVGVSGDTYLDLNQTNDTFDGYVAGQQFLDVVWNMSGADGWLGTANDTYIKWLASAGNYVSFHTGDGTERGRFQDGGLKLPNSTVDVNEILNTADGDSIDASSTDDQLATAKLIYNELQALTTGSGVVDHNLLSNLQGGSAPDEYYHLDATDYSVLSAITSTDVSNWDSAYSHSTSFHVSSHSDLTGVAGSGDEYHVSQNVYNAMSSDGSTLTITGTVSATGDVDVDGSFSFDSGTAVDNIVTSISGPGADTNLVTEQAIVEWVDSVSGTLQSQITGQNEFIELIDTPAAYAGSEGDYLRVNASGTAVVFDSTINDWMADSEEPTGFAETNTDSTISYSGNTVTISGSYNYWIKGTRYTKNGADQVAISDSTEGLQFIYFDGATLSYSTTFSNDILSDYAYVASAYWDNTNSGIIMFGDERHGMIMDNATHINLHYGQGTIYLSGLSPNNVNVDEDGSLNAHAQFGMGSGYILDEDLRLTISAVAVSGTLPVFYRDGADGGGVWRTSSQNGYAFLSGATPRPKYNLLSGGNWTQPEITNNYYTLVHVFATNDPDQPFISIMGQSQHSTASAAGEAAADEMNTLVLSGLPTVEWVAVATFILHGFDALTNDVNARYISTLEGDDFIDWRYASLTGGAGGSSANVHGNLAGLTDPNQHPASSIYTSTTNFDGALSSADDTVQKALDTLDNSMAMYGHAHYELDLTLSGSNVWTVTDGDVTGMSTDDMDVYLNGLLNRDHTDYFTASVNGNKLTVTFAYNTYEADWAHVKFWKDQA